MKKWLVSEVGAYFLAEKLDCAGKFIIRLRLAKTKKQLRELIQSQVIKIYGDETYYHDFDMFLERQGLVTKLLNSLYETTWGKYKSIYYYQKIIVESFVEDFPQYTIYKNALKQMVLTIYKCIFDSLNECSDENARVIINNAKELVGELEEQIKFISEQNQEICNDTHRIYHLLMEMNKSSYEKELSLDNDDVKVGLELYKSSLKTLYWNKSGYIERTLEREEGKKVIDALIENKKVLLLGEPGCGKTTEALIVLEEICVRKELDEIIPVYMSLAEYGVRFADIKDGIKKKMELYIPRIDLLMINQLISSGKIILILDGADEINSLEDRSKFYFDINEVLALSNAQVFLTSRRNQYHGDAKNIKEISVSKIERTVIDEKLREAGINCNISNDFYDLFAYPLFLEIGITVLQKNNCKLLNKSQLFEKYIYALFYEREIEKGIRKKQSVNFGEVMNIISRIAYQYFDKPSFSFLEFDKLLLGTEYSHANICDLFRLDIFSMDGAVKFSHKQFKEYFAAYYLVNNFSILEIPDVYLEHMYRDEWQEVMVFASGIFDNLDEQNCFLDVLVKVNLKTYIRCVRLKNDLSLNLRSYSHEEYSKYYLKILFESYSAIVNTYFPNLKKYFNPKIGKNAEALIGKKACIVGQISQDNQFLTYWFDWKPIHEESVQLIEGTVKDAFIDMECRAIKERRNISTYAMNLEYLEYGKDSARAVAIKRVEEDIQSILENRNLLEDDFILCEKLTDIKKNVKSIKNSISIEEMYLEVKAYVDTLLKRFEGEKVELGGVSCGKVDMLELLEILEILYMNNATYKTLPKPDVHSNGGWIWNFYSKEQIVKVVEEFFRQVVVSYHEVVALNFPHMQKYFHMSQDYPMKYKVRVRFREGDGYDSEPWISYYYVSTREEELEPEVIVVGEEDDAGNYTDIFQEICSSYFKNGKETKGASITKAGVMMCIDECVKGFNDSPVGAFVYRQIENEFWNLFDE